MTSPIWVTAVCSFVCWRLPLEDQSNLGHCCLQFCLLETAPRGPVQSGSLLFAVLSVGDYSLLLRINSFSHIIKKIGNGKR